MIQLIFVWKFDLSGIQSVGGHDCPAGVVRLTPGLVHRLAQQVAAGICRDRGGTQVPVPHAEHTN